MSELKAGDPVTWKTNNYTAIGEFRSDGTAVYKVSKILGNGFAYIMDLDEFEGIAVRLSELSRAEPNSDCHSYDHNVWTSLQDLA